MMKRKLNLKLVLIISTIFSNCTEVIDFNLEKEPSNLVITGSITTNPGPYTVTIKQSIGFFNQFEEPENNITGACVMISNDDGEKEELTDVGSGVYQTDPKGIKGEIGKSYTLTITTSDGNTYISTSEKIMESLPIEKIYYKEIEKTEKNNFNIPITAKFVEISIETFDNPNEDNYYSWIWSGTYRFYSHPELFPLPCPPTLGPVAPEDICPPPCLNLDNNNPCTCCTCWVTTNDNNDLVILDDELINSNNPITQKIIDIPINTTTFEDKYYVSVEQRSMTKTAFDFWEKIKNQENTNTLFATPSALIESNIINTNNSNELVYGNFSAYGVSEISLFIDRKELSDIPFDIYQFIGDCTRKKGSSIQKPDFWE